MYEKHYKEIVSALQKRMPAGDVFTWARDNAPELYARERALDAELNRLWDADLDGFKMAVMGWGRTILQIIQQFQKEKL